MKKVTRQNGISIIGAMIAMLILAIGIIGLIQLQSVVIRNKAIAAQHSEAIVLAENKIAEFRNFSKIPVTSGSTAYDDIVSGTSSVTRNAVSYTLSWTVTEVVNPPHKVVSVSVTWTDSTNENRTVTLSSQISPVDPVTSGQTLEGV